MYADGFEYELFDEFQDACDGVGCWIDSIYMGQKRWMWKTDFSNLTLFIKVSEEQIISIDQLDNRKPDDDQI